jgi:hypothetical protein
MARRRIEPFVLSLQGREALYEEKFYCVIRVARVVTDEWGMQALAVPLFGFRFEEYHPEPPMEPWTFGLQWADTRHYRSELSGGMFSPTLDADENVIRALRALCRPGSVATQELRQALCAKGDARGEVPCPWVKADPARARALAANGEVWECDASQGDSMIHKFTALGCLRETAQFCAGFDPNENLIEFAYGALLREPDAKGAFRSLLAEKRAAPRLYGLRGLYELGAPAYKIIHATYRQSTERVLLQENGKPLRSATMAEVVRRIHAGEFRITNEYYFR